MRITINGNWEVYDLLDNIEHFQSSSIFRRRLNNSNRNMRRFWKKNVYKIFDRRKSREHLPISGNLGRAMTIDSRDRAHIKIGTKVLSRNRSGISGGPCRDYVNIIMNGSQEGRGVYSRRLDKKIKVNSGFYTPGVPFSLGVMWNITLEQKAREQYKRAMELTLKEIGKV